MASLTCLYTQQHSAQSFTLKHQTTLHSAVCVALPDRSAVQSRLYEAEDCSAVSGI